MQVLGQPVPVVEEVVDEEEEEEREFEEQLQQWKKAEVSSHTHTHKHTHTPNDQPPTFTQGGVKAKPKYSVKTFDELTVCYYMYITCMV